MKIALGDRRRKRRFPRTTFAARVASIEIVAAVALLAAAGWLAASAFWIPLVVATPFVIVELWFDIRARSRRLVPEVAGAIAIATVAATIALADGVEGRIAIGLWLVLAGRVVASVPYVRDQIARIHGRPGTPGLVRAAELAGIVITAVAVALDERLLAGALAVVGLVVVQVLAARRRQRTATALGIEQTLLGLAVVGVTAIGVLTA